MTLQGSGALYSPSQLDGAPEEVPPWRRRFEKGSIGPDCAQEGNDAVSAVTSECRSMAEGGVIAGSAAQVRSAAAFSSKDSGSAPPKRRRRFDVRPEDAVQQLSSSAHTSAEPQSPQRPPDEDKRGAGERSSDGEARRWGEGSALRTAKDQSRECSSAGERSRYREDVSPRRERWHSERNASRCGRRDAEAEEDVRRKRLRDEGRDGRRRERLDEGRFSHSRQNREEERRSAGRPLPRRRSRERRSPNSERKRPSRSSGEERRHSPPGERGEAAVAGTDSSSADFSLNPEELERQLRLQREQQRQNEELRLEFEREVQRQLHKQLQQNAAAGDNAFHAHAPGSLVYSSETAAFPGLCAADAPQPLQPASLFEETRFNVAAPSSAAFAQQGGLSVGAPRLEGANPVEADSAAGVSCKALVPSSLELLMNDAAAREAAARSSASASPWLPFGREQRGVESSASAQSPHSPPAALQRESALGPQAAAPHKALEENASGETAALSGGADSQAAAAALDTTAICQRVEKLQRLRLCLNCKDPLPRPDSALARSAGSSLHVQGICKGCLRHVGRSECRHCGVEFLQHRYAQQAEMKLGRAICIPCARQMSKHKAEPSICRFCQCWAAWNDVHECDRCRSRIARHGLPKKCQRCGVQAAFPHSRTLPESEFKEVCFLCHCFLKKEIATQQRNRQRMHQTLQLMQPGKVGDSLETLPSDTPQSFDGLQSLQAQTLQNSQKTGNAAASGEAPSAVEAQLEQARKEVADLRDQLLRKDLHLEDVQQRNVNQEKQLQLELQALRKRCHQLTLDVKRVEANSEALTAKFLEEKREVEATHASQLDALHVCVDQLKARNDALEKETHKHNAEVLQLKRQLALASREAQESNKKLEAVSSAQNAREAEVQELKAAASLAADSKKQLLEQLREEQKTHADTRRALREAKERLSEMQKKIDTLHDGHQQTREEEKSSASSAAGEAHPESLSHDAVATQSRSLRGGEETEEAEKGTKEAQSLPPEKDERSCKRSNVEASQQQPPVAAGGAQGDSAAKNAVSVAESPSEEGASKAAAAAPLPTSTRGASGGEAAETGPTESGEDATSIPEKAQKESNQSPDAATAASAPSASSPVGEEPRQSRGGAERERQKQRERKKVETAAEAPAADSPPPAEEEAAASDSAASQDPPKTSKASRGRGGKKGAPRGGRGRGGRGRRGARGRTRGAAK